MPNTKNCRLDIEFNTTNSNATPVAPPSTNGLIPPANYTGISSTDFVWYQGQPGNWNPNGQDQDDMKMPLAVIAGQTLVINVLDEQLSTILQNSSVEAACYVSSDDTPTGTRTYVAAFANYGWGSANPTNPVSLTNSQAVVLTTPANVALANAGNPTDPNQTTATVLTLQFAQPNVLNGFVNSNNQPPTKIFINVAVYLTMQTPAGSNVNCWEDPEMEVDQGGVGEPMASKAGA